MTLNPTPNPYPRAAQVAAQMKGDRADRIKIQARKEADKRRMEDEQQRDELLVEATTMARMGAR